MEYCTVPRSIHQYQEEGPESILRCCQQALRWLLSHGNIRRKRVETVIRMTAL